MFSFGKELQGFFPNNERVILQVRRVLRQEFGFHIQITLSIAGAIDIKAR